MKIKENQEIIKKQQQLIKEQQENALKKNNAQNSNNTKEGPIKSKPNEKTYKTVNVKKATQEEQIKTSSVDKLVNIVRNRRIQLIVIALVGYLVLTMLIGLVMEIITFNFSFNPFHMIYLTFTHKASLIISIIALAVISLFIYLLVKNKPDEEDEGYKISEEDTYGSSKKGDIYSEEAADNIQIGDSFEEMDDMVFGYDDNGKFVGLNKNTSLVRNSYIVGPPGSGKTTGFIHNMVLQLIKQGKSVVLTDPKGELREATYHAFKDNGYKVKELNFKDLVASDSWNMLSDAGIDGLDYLVEVLINNTGHTEYDNAEGNLLTALCMYVLTYEKKTRKEIWEEYYEKRRNGEKVDLDHYKDLAEESMIDDRTFGAAYNLLNEKSESEIDALFAKLEPTHPARMPYNTLLSGGSDSKFKKNIFIGLSTRMRLFRRNIIQRVTGFDDIDTTLPIREKCAYFLIFPDQDKTYTMLSALFIEFLVRNMVQYYDNTHGEKNLQKVHFLLDEFLIIGKFEKWSDTLSGARGRGIEITMITQSLSYMKSVYPNDVYANMLGCCDIQIILGSNDEFTENYYSAKSGEATIEVETSRKGVAESLLQSEGAELGTSEGVGRRMVYTPAEIRKIRKRKDNAPLGDLIIFLSGDDSYKLHKYPSFMNETYKRVTKKHEKAINHIPLWLEDLAMHTNFADKKDGIYSIVSEDRRTPALLKLIDASEKEYVKMTINQTLQELKKGGYDVQRLDYNKYYIKNFNYKFDFEELMNNGIRTTAEILKKLKQDIDGVDEESPKNTDTTKEQNNPEKQDKQKIIRNNYGQKPKQNNNQNNTQNKKEKPKKYQEGDTIPII